VAEEKPYRIIRRQEITMGPGLPDAFTQVVVTYTAPGLPPFALFLAKSEATDEEIDKRIRANLEARKAERAL